MKIENNIKIIILGGQDEHGKKCLLIETNESIFIINFGIQIPINNINGIDMIISDFDYLIKNKSKIKGIFINNIQDESFAGLPWFLMKIKNIKIFSSQFAQEIIKKRITKYNISNKNYNFSIINKKTKIGDIFVTPIKGGSATLGTLGFNFSTKYGEIIFLSSMTLKNLNNFGNLNLKDIDKKNVLALIIDSNNASIMSNLENENHSIKKLIEKKFLNNRRIIFGVYDDQMFTINEIIELAIKYKYPICFYGSNISFLFNTAISLNKNFKFPHIIDHKKINAFKKIIVIVSATWSRLYNRLLRIAINKDVYLKLEPSDQIVIAAPPVNGLEVEASQTLDEIAKRAIDIMDISNNEFESINFTGNEIASLIKILNPRYFLPIFALYYHMKEAKNIAIENKIPNDKIIILKNGKVANFIDGKLESQNKFIENHGSIIIDGFGIGDVSIQVIKERQRLSSGGLIIANILFNKKENQKKIIKKINFEFKGIGLKNQHNDFKKSINEIIINKLSENEELNNYELQPILSKTIRKFFSKKYNKDPVVIINIFIIKN